MDKINDLLEGMKMCCIGMHTTGGVVGLIQLLIGGCQIGIGIYFLLTFPGFYIASNIWTGIATGLAGISLMYYGYANSPTRSNYIFLVFIMFSLLMNILNVVIVQVGEKSKFLTEEDKKFLEEKSEKKFFDIAIYSSTIISSVVIIFTFAVAQCLFFGHLKRPKLQSQIAFVESLNEERAKDAPGHRFFPPSRLAAKELIQPLPPLEDVLRLSVPNPALNNSEWVYSSEDKISKGLYPLGLENNPKCVESTSCSTARYSSFAAPRYARVHQRPKRAQSFASSRDPFSLHGSGHIIRPLPVPIPQLHYATMTGQRLRKSNSFTYNMNDDKTAALSRKYQAFTLNRDVNYSVIEVGSLKSLNSEHNCYAVADLTNDVPAQNCSSHMKNASSNTQLNEAQHNEDISKEKSLKPSVQRVLKAKGPAPLPPCNNSTSTFKRNANSKDNFLSSIDEIRSEEQLDDEENDLETPKQILQLSREKSLRGIDENLNINSEPDIFQEDRGLGENEISTSSYDSNTNRSTSNYEASNDTSSICGSEKGEIILQAQEGFDVKQVKNLIGREEALVNSENETIRTEEQPQHDTFYGFKANAEYDEISSVSNSINAYKDIRSTPNNTYEVENAGSQGHSGNSLQKCSKYEIVHREIVAEAKLLLDQLPSGEVQKNKIVLRVPSFKTTGCQTESYRPLRRRASCSQGNIFMHPNYFPSKEARTISYRKERKVQNVSQVLSVGSSSSSGYSSPDGGSKYTSPIQSGPPSPCSSYEAVSEEASNNQDEPNVTVIEVNKQNHRHFSIPKMLMPSRFRNLSDSFANFSTIEENSTPIQNSQEKYGLELLPHNIQQLTQAINPMILSITAENERIPRIINAIYKTPQKPNSFNDNETFTERDENFRSSSSECISYNGLPFPRKATYTSSSPSLLETQAHSFSNSNSTAAFLASLELLASHYRQRALANAKELQIQQTILEHSNLHQS